MHDYDVLIETEGCFITSWTLLAEEERLPALALEKLSGKLSKSEQRTLIKMSEQFCLPMLERKMASSLLRKGLIRRIALGTHIVTLSQKGRAIVSFLREERRTVIQKKG